MKNISVEPCQKFPHSKSPQERHRENGHQQKFWKFENQKTNCGRKDKTVPGQINIPEDSEYNSVQDQCVYSLLGFFLLLEFTVKLSSVHRHSRSYGMFKLTSSSLWATSSEMMFPISLERILTMFTTSSALTAVSMWKVGFAVTFTLI